MKSESIIVLVLIKGWKPSVYCVYHHEKLYNCPQSVFLWLVWFSEQTAVVCLYSINWSVFIIEMNCVYCTVQTDSKMQFGLILACKGLSTML
jgi:hypothetical protein